MPIPDENLVKTALTAIEPMIYEIVYGAFRDWRKVAELGRLTYARSRATIIHERSVYRAIEEFSSNPNINIHEKHETAWFTVDDNVMFRFKRGHGLGFSRNFPTLQALLFHDP